MPAMRNNILMLLAHKTSAELLEREGKAKLAEEIRARRRARWASRSRTRRGGGRRRCLEEEEKEEEAEVELPVVAVHFSNFIIQ
jgi:flagellar FliL protein